MEYGFDSETSLKLAKRERFASLVVLAADKAAPKECCYIEDIPSGGIHEAIH
jgi:hypothetical protein